MSNQGTTDFKDIAEAKDFIEFSLKGIKHKNKDTYARILQDFIDDEELDAKNNPHLASGLRKMSIAAQELLDELK